MTEVSDDPRFLAGIEMLNRTGAKTFRVGYTPEEDGSPVVWYACAEWSYGADAAASLSPLYAVLRLCEQVIDGGECAHCGRLTIFEYEIDGGPFLNAMGCVYAYDPELKTFRRNCEGD